MNKQIKEAFLQVKADEELKNKTLSYVTKETRNPIRTRSKRHRLQVYGAAFVCFVFIIFGSHWLYFTPTSAISVDINPSIELGINRFNHVISVESFNKDGTELSKNLNVKFKNYEKAIDRILRDETISELMHQDEVMTITVTGSDTNQSSEVFSTVKACTSGHKNTYCYASPPEDAEAAHKVGLSCGKYRAFLELRQLDSSITPDKVQNMTMRQIRELIAELSRDSEKSSGSGRTHHENHENNHSGQRQRKRLNG